MMKNLWKQCLYAFLFSIQQIKFLQIFRIISRGGWQCSWIVGISWNTQFCMELNNLAFSPFFVSSRWSEKWPISRSDLIKLTLHLTFLMENQWKIQAHEDQGNNFQIIKRASSFYEMTECYFFSFTSCIVVWDECKYTRLFGTLSSTHLINRESLVSNYCCKQSLENLQLFDNIWNSPYNVKFQVRSSDVTFFEHQNRL